MTSIARQPPGAVLGVPPVFTSLAAPRPALADGIVEQELVLLPGAFSFLSSLGQRAQPVAPFRLQGVGNQVIARIYQHE